MQHIDISCEAHSCTSNKYAMLDRDSEELVSFDENEELDAGDMELEAKNLTTSDLY